MKNACFRKLQKGKRSGLCHEGLFFRLFHKAGNVGVIQLSLSESQYLQDFIHPRWLFGISSINSSTPYPTVDGQNPAAVDVFKTHPQLLQDGWKCAH